MTKSQALTGCRLCSPLATKDCHVGRIVSAPVRVTLDAQTIIMRTNSAEKPYPHSNFASIQPVQWRGPLGLSSRVLVSQFEIRCTRSEVRGASISEEHSTKHACPQVAITPGALLRDERATGTKAR